MADNLKSNEEANPNNKINPTNSQHNNESLDMKKDEKQTESQNEKDENKEKSVDAYNSAIKENINSASNNEKSKRHRRGKNETTAERTYKCPDCDKCYLSGPALIIHRKNKHGYNPEMEKKSRDRPKKEEQQETSFQNAQLKYDNFLNNSTRKKNGENENEENEDINLDVIKDNFTNIFRQCKTDLFSNIEKIDNYPFYQLTVNNWEKDNQELEKEFFNDSNKNDNETTNKGSIPYLDQIFFLYLKEFAAKTNKNYYWFLHKFIVLFREYINSSKKEQIREANTNGIEKEYSQLFNAEGIPESCNDFFLEFMQPNKYYGLNEGELIELAQHFCFWLYLNKYTHSYLILL